MPNRLTHKKSSVPGRIPVVGDLEYGELALNFHDGKLYYRTDTDDIAEIRGATPAIPDNQTTVWDWWSDGRIGNNNIAALGVFVGAPISSGTNTFAIPAASVLGYNPFGVFLRSSTTANGGYRYSTSSVGADVFGVISHKMRWQFMWRTAFTGRTVRGGYLDTTTSADAQDGAYFEIVDDECRAKTANGGTRTTHATTLTLALDTPYTFDVEVNAAGTEARFRVYSGTTVTPAMDVTITTDIPGTSAQFGAGVVATESSTTLSNIGILYSIGIGTIEGFNSRDVSGILGDIQTILESV